jgi:hypothetical protein
MGVRRPELKQFVDLINPGTNNRIRIRSPLSSVRRGLDPGQDFSGLSHLGYLIQLKIEEPGEADYRQPDAKTFEKADA